MLQNTKCPQLQDEETEDETVSDKFEEELKTPKGRKVKLNKNHKGLNAQGQIQARDDAVQNVIPQQQIALYPHSQAEVQQLVPASPSIPMLSPGMVAYGQSPEQQAAILQREPMSDSHYDPRMYAPALMPQQIPQQIMQIPHQAPQHISQQSRVPVQSNVVGHQQSVAVQPGMHEQ